MPRATASQSREVIELISFKLCPFVQRSVITLLKKGIDFTITYIDLSHKPDWFLALSPLGKVPVVRYGDDVIFESAVINEFLDEITHDRIMPTDPLQKAKDRGWIEYSSQVIMTQFSMSIAHSESEFEAQATTLHSQLKRLEQKMTGQDYFNGETFSLVDSAIAPLYTRFDILKTHCHRDFLSPYPNLSRHSHTLTTADYVRSSVVEDFDHIYINFLKEKNSFIVSHER